MYGQKQIVLEKDEVESIKKFEDPGLHLIGFKPMDKLKLHHHVKPSVFLYPEEEQITGTRSLLLDHYTTLHQPCIQPIQIPLAQGRTWTSQSNLWEVRLAQAFILPQY